jgi:hypothetical protein
VKGVGVWISDIRYQISDIRYQISDEELIIEAARLLWLGSSYLVDDIQCP